MFIFNVGSKEFKIEVVIPFPQSEQMVLYLSVREGSEWSDLSYPTIYGQDVDTREKTDSKLTELFNSMSDKIADYLGDTDIEIPESGFDRIKYILENLAKFENGKITF